MTDKRLDQDLPPHERRVLSEWKAPLLLCVGALFFFESASGLVVWLGVAGLAGQFTVLSHTLAGIIFLAPLTWYTIRHYRMVRPQPMNYVKLLGWASAIVLVLCCGSGAVVTWQAAMGTSITPAWHWIHLVSSVATVLFLGLHAGVLVARALRRRESGSARIVGAQGAAFGWTLGGAVILSALTLLSAALYRPPDFSWRLPDDYSFKYGPNPFAPSLARTATGQAYHPKSLSGSASCGRSGCHEQIYEEWLPSAHRYAAMDPAFQMVQSVMAKNEGAESTRYCGGCHDPIALFSGMKNIYSEDLSFEGAQEGISCTVCHSITETDVRGNAQYAVARPAPYAWERDDSASGRLLSGFLIRSIPDAHVRAYSRSLYKSPEYCGACHKQFIDQEINKVGWVQLQNQYDNWKASPWNKPGRPAETLTCRECHMRLADSNDPASGDASDFNRSPGDHKHRSHRFIAANQFVPDLLKLPGHEEHTRLTESWLRGQSVVAEIADRWPGGAVAPIQLVAPATAAPGRPITVRAVVTNRKVGHDFPTGPLDIIQAWVEMTVVDQDGREIFHSGKLNAEHFLEKGAFIFKAEGIDQYGNLIDRHNLWEMVGARFRRALFPGMSDTDEYTFQCPAMESAPGKAPAKREMAFTLPPEPGGKLTVTARLLYRKFDQFLVNYLFNRTDLTAPVTEMSRDVATITIERGGGGPHAGL